MQENIFESMHSKTLATQKAQKSFDRSMREAMRMLMGNQEGRMFLRWLGSGQNAQSILQLIMDYEEERHGS